MPGSNKSPTGSNPATPGKGSRRTSNTKTRQSSGKSKTGGRTMSFSSAKSAAESVETPAVTKLRKARGDELEDTGAETPPGDLKPVFLSAPTQSIFGCTTDSEVTVEEPFKLIPKQAIVDDMVKRAAVSDFSVVKQTIQNYAGDSILIAYDPYFKFGENFYIALTEEAKERILKDPEREGGGEGGDDEDGEGEGEPEDLTVYEYQPPESKPWESLGSEMEIEDHIIKHSRDLVTMKVSRQRKLFGAPLVKWKNRSSHAGRDAYIECVSSSEQDSKSFELSRMEMETGVQAIQSYTTESAQTEWVFPTNAATQYEPREFDEETKQRLMQSEEFASTVETAKPRLDLGLQHNVVMNAFVDDWSLLAVEDTTFGSKQDGYLKEYQSFTDLKNSKNKTVTCMDWHPTLKGVVAVSYGERCTLEERVDNLSKIQLTPSLILIWSFSDPIQPQLILEAPDDICAFRFNPTDPYLVAGGCVNGQVVLWDISGQNEERLKRSKRAKVTKANTMNTLPGYIDESSIITPVVNYCAVSMIDQSHKNWVTDLQWIPDHIDINRQGQILENHKASCVELVTSGCDGHVMFWDIRAPKGTSNLKPHDNPLKVPNTFKYLDLLWKPIMRIPIHRTDGHGEHSPYVFSYRETQGDRSILPTLDAEEERQEEERRKQAESVGLRPSSPKEKKVLQGASTHYFVGTEDGEIIYLDWTLEKDTETGKLVHKSPEWVKATHDGPVKTLDRSPFFKEVLLSVGGWNFCIWLEACAEPLMQSQSHNCQLTHGRWSPTRAGVFFISKSDGCIDVWDLLDRTSDPVLTQSVSPHAITKLNPIKISTNQQLLAIGDSYGTLHVLEVPWVLRQGAAKEPQAVMSYLEREKERLEYMETRREGRLLEKRERDAKIQQQKQLDAAASKVTDEEERASAEREVQQYFTLEKKLRIELGLEEEVL
ncbi:dynein axonemal intermediate chain 3-like [Symsagittifera roscoffensis]|uniref:dynein axonemal intermediate chain 3-like n=1 Tax=Symsagittifera roscoffensis TaxID=84072 RepID=UPI00307BF5E2